MRCWVMPDLQAMGVVEIGQIAWLVEDELLKKEVGLDEARYPV